MSLDGRVGLHPSFSVMRMQSATTQVRHLFAATILATRKLIDIDPNKPNMAKGYFVDRAIDDAAFILERIDARWPTIVNSFSAKEP